MSNLILNTDKTAGTSLYVSIQNTHLATGPYFKPYIRIYDDPARSNKICEYVHATWVPNTSYFNMNVVLSEHGGSGTSGSVTLTLSHTEGHGFVIQLADPRPYKEFKIIVDRKHKAIARVGGIYTADTCLYIIEHGIEGTSEIDFTTVNNKEVALDAVPYYEPVVVTVDGTKAENLTNYYNGEHLAFTDIGQSPSKYQFVHIGRNLYLNTATDKDIIVDFRYKAKYIKLVAKLTNSLYGGSSVTPILNSYKIAVQTSRR